ncbi:E3 ubiquitin-protein ligase NRDP1 [Tetranychus urticae]|uniref:RING-type domain-containing protein n=1 Tax=Tetranychus urticae TaxID=32264 RepID=T1KFV5_TETUR|nr:E3 ubiquitin-protein ligase NRDP1 [Tetranychus urticae]
MGYDVERFLGSIDEELKCPICCGVLEDPLQGQRCEHAFCRKCITEWMKTSETCPVDRNSLSSSQLQPIPRIVRNMLNHLSIRCDFIAEGCREVISLEDLSSHKSECKYNPEHPVPCLRDCGALVPKNRLESHDCIKDLRSLICCQQKEIQELKSAITILVSLSEQQKRMASLNNSSLHDLSERYEHLKNSITNLEKPIQQILQLAIRSDSLPSGETGTSIKDKLVEETTLEIYISNVDRCVTAGNLRDYLARNDVNVIACKESLYRGWKSDFRITIFKSDCSKVLDPNLWPRGIVCFVCGEYYSTKTEGNRDPQEPGPDSIVKASPSPWMIS